MNIKRIITKANFILMSIFSISSLISILSITNPITANAQTRTTIPIFMTAKPECEFTGNHSFTVYVYNNDATYESDGTATAKCDYGCNTIHTKTSPGTRLIKPATIFQPETDVIKSNPVGEEKVVDNIPSATPANESKENSENGNINSESKGNQVADSNQVNQSAKPAGQTSDVNSSIPTIIKGSESNTTEKSTVIEGYLTDRFGLPIRNAKVEIDYSGQKYESKTDNDGYYNIIIESDVSQNHWGDGDL